MNTRKEMKQQARKIVFGHYGILLAVCLVAIILGTEFTGSFDIFKLPGDTEREAQARHELIESEFGVDRSNVWGIAYSIIDGSIAKEEKTADELTDQAVKKSEDETNEVFGRSAGVFANVVNGLTSGLFFVKIVKIIHGLGLSKDAAALAAAMLVTLASLAFWFLFKNVYSAISKRILLECRTYESGELTRMFFFLRAGKWLNVCKTMFMAFFFQWLWSLTIIGGVIKYYSYFLVPYIAAENPEIGWKDCITLSRKMMYGHKWECFVAELSFLLWDVLGILTLGVSDLFYVNMYKSAFFAEYYAKLRMLSKQNALPGSELLNDEFLFAKADKETLQNAYSDIAALREKQQDEVIPTGWRGFVEKNFGITMYNCRDEEKFWAYQKRALVIEAAESAAGGAAYPDRLSPNPIHRQNNHFERLHYMRHYSIGSLVLLFFTFSLIGWIWEVSFHFYEDGVFVNRGIMHGPWLPIYGFGCLMILTLLYRLRKSPAKEFLAAIGLCGLVEYFTSYFMELAYGGVKWWDYSGYFLNIDGRICAEGLLVFGIGGMLIVYLIAPLFDNFIRRIKPAALVCLCVVLLSVFVCDQIYSAKHPNEGAGVTFAADGGTAPAVATATAADAGVRAKEE